MTLDDVEQLGRSSDHVQESQKNRKELLRSILTEDGRCNYVSPEGKPCDFVGRQPDRSQARHWLIVHAMNEAVEIEAGRLTMGQATIVTTEARKDAVLVYATKCPVGACRKSEREKCFVRLEELLRHVSSCSKRHARKHGRNGWPSEEVEKWAKTWAKEHMQLAHRSRKRESPYYEAVRSILDA